MFDKASLIMRLYIAKSLCLSKSTMAQGVRLEILYSCISFANLWIRVFIAVCWFLNAERKGVKDLPSANPPKSSKGQPGQSRPSGTWVAEDREK